MLKNPRNKIYTFAILLFIIALVVFLFSLYINSRIILEKKEIPATLSVSEIASFDVSRSALTFGTIIPGSSASRNLTLKNNYTFPVKFEFRAKGNIKNFLIYERAVYLEPGEKKSIRINTIIPNDEEYGNYSGKIVIRIRIKKDI